MGRDDDDLQATAIAMRRAGRTRREIREALGIGESRLSDWVRDIPPGDRSRRPRAKDEVRARARELREQMWSVPRIAAELGVARSTVWLWTKDTGTLPKPAPGEALRRGQKEWRARENWRRNVERWRVKMRAGREIRSLRQREMLIAGAVLYWAEGAKDKPWDRRESLDFANSDPDVIRFYLRWLALLEVDVERLRFSVQIHETADVEAALRFWAELVGVPVESFQKASIKRHNPRTNRRNVAGTYRGCLRVKVLRSAELYQRVEGLWLAIARAPVETAGPPRPRARGHAGLARLDERDRTVAAGGGAATSPGLTASTDHPGVFHVDGP